MWQRSRELEALESRILLSRVHSALGSGTEAHSAVAMDAMPAIASNLAVTNASAGVVQLNWADNSNNETGFEVLRRTGSSGKYKVITALAPGSTHFSDSAVRPNSQYGYEIVAVNQSAVSSPSGQESIKTLPPPVAPVNLTAAASSATSIHLAWANTSSNQSGLTVMQRGGASKAWTVIANLAGDATSYVSKVLTPNTFYGYEILAVSGSMTSKPSKQVAAKTGVLSAVAMSPTSVQLTWTAAALMKSFTVERKIASAATWSAIASVDGSTTKSASYSYLDSGLSAGTEYIYQVIPVAAKKGAVPSNLADVTTLPPPAAPSNLSATELSAHTIRLSWKDNASNADSYSVARKAGDSGAWTTVATLAPNATTFSDTSLQVDTQYDYAVIATSAGADSSPSNLATAVTLPATPGNLSVAAVSVDTVQLSWVNFPNNKAGFLIERQDGNSGVWNTEASLMSPTATSFADTNVQAGTRYTYEVIAVNGGLVSDPSNQVVATTLPAAPMRLLVNPLTTTSIQLNWSDSSINETGFQLLRQSGTSGTWTVAANLAAGVMGFTDTGLLANTPYTYEVLAVNSGTTSAPSNQATGSTLQAPNAATGLSATVLTASQVQLSWADNSNNETGFKIARSTDGVHFSTVATVGANVTMYTDTGLAASTAYSYLVVTTNAAGDAATPSNVVTATTAAVILPGTGFTGATAQPAAVGTGSMATENAIARWDVVPYQTFSGEFNVGVVAFDSAGMDHVAFSVNGGAWVNVSTMTLNTQVANNTGVGNPSNGVVEYWATLDARTFAADGPIEVRAIAYPKVGVPRVLQGATIQADGGESLSLSTNAHGTLPSLARYVSSTGSDVSGDGSSAAPFASVVKAALSIQAAQGSVDGGTIYLMAGAYVVKAAEWNQGVTSSTRWLTITRAPGLAESDVTITGNAPNSAGNNDGLMTNLVRVADITMTGTVMGSSQNTDSIWYDNIVLNGPGRTTGFVFTPTQFEYGYITNSMIADVQDAVDNFNLCRDVQIHGIAQWSFYNTPFAINSTVADSDRGTNTNLHPDMFYMYGTPVNVIAYGITATDRINAFGLRFQQSALDVAIVDCQISVTTPANFQMERPYQNMLLMDTSLLGATTVYQGTFSALDVVFDNMTFYQSPGAHAGVTFR